MTGTGALPISDGSLALSALLIGLNLAISSLLRLGLGGGITWDSDPEQEYLETVHKGATLVRCLRS